jgi:uncharacterized protein YjbJ (UPF0337 family)
MDRDSVSRAISKVLGGIQEAMGKAIGNREMEAQGKAKKVDAAAQKTVANVKDATREIDSQQ